MDCLGVIGERLWNGCLDAIIPYFIGEQDTRPLSQRLTGVIAAVHKELGTHPFLASLLEGDCSAERYIAFLFLNYKIHMVLEDGQEKMVHYHRAVPKKELCIFPSLYRSMRIVQDLTAWRTLSDTTQKTSALGPHGMSLIGHILDLAEENPLFTLAPMYVFYGGLLSGGQVLKERMERERGSTSLFNFPEIPDIKSFKKKEWDPAFDGARHLLPSHQLRRLEDEAARLMHAFYRALDEINS